jgi:plasmid stabilization system protein ParE
MIPHRFDPDARADFLAAIAYYEECRAGLGRRFRQAVEVAIIKACETPLSYRVLRAPFRRCLVPRFPYSVIFSIEQDHILVIAIAHAKRKPGYWISRKK